ncbi:hypothetical protein AVEN_113908-1 [Araneus ventricosus]|uniref:Uncharacterized protein n=1 Tax=Araneus ventricosus TaxID=182803 RepID=A0A4Y2LIQ8_ARAVE|nr:hypothetical protein AVEN_113908-1 [Araneus ventricosus]
MIRTSQRMSLLDESRWKKHEERYTTVITDDRRNATRMPSSMPTMHRETSYTLWGLMLTLQNLPTLHWSDNEISLLVAEAYRLKYMFDDAPNHLQPRES